MTIKTEKNNCNSSNRRDLAGTGEAGKTAVYHAGEMNVESVLETIR